jgi:hypothetical protein
MGLLAGVESSLLAEFYFRPIFALYQGGSCMPAAPAIHNPEAHPARPRPVPAPLRTRLTLRPSQPGTKQLRVQCGERLVCVRYRYDEQRQKRLKTVE